LMLVSSNLTWYIIYEVVTNGALIGTFLPQFTCRPSLVFKFPDSFHFP
jgi:hypothetical protein